MRCVGESQQQFPKEGNMKELIAMTIAVLALSSSTFATGGCGSRSRVTGTKEYSGRRVSLQPIAGDLAADVEDGGR